MSLAFPRKLLINLKYYLATRTSYGKKCTLAYGCIYPTKENQVFFNFVVYRVHLSVRLYKIGLFWGTR